MEVFDYMKEYDWVEIELVKFNLEINFDLWEFIGYCLSELEKENVGKLDKISDKFKDFKVWFIFMGILFIF